MSEFFIKYFSRVHQGPGVFRFVLLLLIFLVISLSYFFWFTH